MLRFLPLMGSAIYGIALAALAIAGLWTAFLGVACVGGPLTGLMYLLIARSNRAGKRRSELAAVCRCRNDTVNAQAAIEPR